MTWLRRAVPAVAVAFLFSTPTMAQVSGHPFEVSGGAGVFKYDIRSRVKRGPAFGGAVGWRAATWLTLEAQAVLGPSEADTFPNLKHNFTAIGADLRWNLKSAEARVVPFVITGIGYGRSHTSGHPPDKLERGAPSLGLGVLYNVVNPSTYVRLQIRDVMFRERDADEFSHHYAATAGVQVVVGGKYRDQDLDRVRDWLDQCPDTPIGCTVDSRGCPVDADGDSVCDGVDKCAQTPRGCKVSADGCPVDSDGDGVCDGLDQCADTPKGCTVNGSGCPSDADGDGVCDGVDQCADSPKGCSPDSSGCTRDGDGDGICDALDTCPNTPAGTPVGPNGCPTRIGAFERLLLDSGLVRVPGIIFEAGKATIAPASLARLDSVGVVLQQYPTLKIEIGGPTDIRGEGAIKERLSLDEVKAVIQYLQSKFPLIDASRLTMRGYSGAAPSTTTSRPVRRRLELKVLNADQLAGERVKRGLQKPE